MIVSGVLVSSLVMGATAQEIPQTTTANRRANTQTLNDRFEDVFFTFDQTFYQNRRFPRNGLWLFGSFPENEIAGDGRVIHKLYTEALRQQTTSDPTLRTADLPTPFSSSLQTDAIYTPEPVPTAPFSPSFRQSAPAPLEAPDSFTPEETSEEPIPALW
ncbi:MAG: hypothetical protein HC772_01775 [Leptolyngbyaceae cyanobacterium CRU_2_3]|nr:hypothetical protein [Leptolyngbyaceae cyanobacterium CRU_2_3]